MYHSNISYFYVNFQMKVLISDVDLVDETSFALFGIFEDHIDIIAKHCLIRVN